MPYKFERDELLQLLIKAYNEGNHGFLDLAESVAERLVDENEDRLEGDPILSEFVVTAPPHQTPYGTDYYDPLASFSNNSLNPVHVSNIQITTTLPDNLVAVNSNHAEVFPPLVTETTKWEPYSEESLIRKDQ